LGVSNNTDGGHTRRSLLHFRDCLTSGEKKFDSISGRGEKTPFPNREGGGGAPTTGRKGRGRLNLYCRRRARERGYPICGFITERKRSARERRGMAFNGEKNFYYLEKRKKEERGLITRRRGRGIGKFEFAKRRKEKFCLTPRGGSLQGAGGGNGTPKGEKTSVVMFKAG